MESFMAHKRHRSLFFIVVLIFASTSMQTSRAEESADGTVLAKQSSPMSPQELFAQVSGSIFVVEVVTQSGILIAQGSGVAVAPDRVVTNKHVVIEGEKIIVIQGEKTRSAKVLKLSPRFDLCLLEVPGLNSDVQPAIRSLESLTVGERVYAIGAPRGLELTLSDGLLSGIRRDETGPVIQTSAPISPGSSGGGLFDGAGKLIGITTFTLRDSQELNFAIASQGIAELTQQPPSATGQAWVGVGDQFMASATITDFAPPPLPSDLEGQRLWSQRMEREMLPLRVKWIKATRAYREALAFQPDDSGVLVKLGTAYAYLDAKDDASDAFRRAVSLRHGDSSVWFEIGRAYERMNDREDSLKAYQEAIHIQPDDASIWIAKANALAPDRRLEIAEALKTAEELKPSNSATWYTIGLAYQSRLNNYKEAETALQEAVRLQPENSSYLLALGQVYALRRERSKAKDIYQRLKAIDPRTAELLLQRIH
jgi:cytochrome c-type biogenesis protein CcmH/NrfG